ncbi:hypothetical protein ABIF66_000011 [Bradyrhizobium japonicum]|uniref:hypothetical protein n=1 Tax=Bradyrhizobium liaoningense TaxID=43992 RepID=UPI001BA64C20|nr:hypothetical protein [Bradyrhizobium liaoningense]MBR1068872.1 hypothetical protein [Bradyrhizobium liaoningense]
MYLEYNLAAYAPPRNDAMLMACWPGKVVAGFDKTSDAELRRRLEAARRKTRPWAKQILHSGIWVGPKLQAEIEN